MSGDTAICKAVARSEAVAAVHVGRGVLGDAAVLFQRHFEGQTACLIADGNTWAAAGAQVEQALLGAGITTRRHILPATPRPKPTEALGEALRVTLAADAATPVAIGSGVINDLVKYAAFRLDRRYLCVATAASMDGYTSGGAPLSIGGFKKTIPCRAAHAVLADLDVIAAAPPEMSGWGFGDMAGKLPAGADWLIADALGVEPLDPAVWAMVQAPLRGWLGRPEAIASGDAEAVAGLFEGLTMVGLAMEAHGTSRPASGADHQIAHLWEMEGLAQGSEPVSHGACVAVGCMATLGLYDWLLSHQTLPIDPKAVLATAPDAASREAAIRAAFGAGEIAERAIAETAAKHLDPATHRARLVTIVETWPSLSTRLRAHLMPQEAMRSLLAAAGAPSDAAAIGVTQAHLRRTIAHARFLRSRYTVLDLLDETGLLDTALDATIARGTA